jgi:hypothetical protein
MSFTPATWIYSGDGSGLSYPHKGQFKMDTQLLSELEEVLRQSQIKFLWNEDTHTWQLERTVNGSTWRSVMYLAPDRQTAEREAAKHIQSFYLFSTR